MNDDPRPHPVHAFPWGSLDALSAADVSALRVASRWAHTFAPREAVSAALRDLAGGEARVFVRGARVFLPTSRASRPDARTHVDVPEGVAVLLAVGGESGAPETGVTVVVEAERALAANLVARVLRRPLPGPAIYGDTRVSPALAGAFAAVVAAVARRAATGTAGAGGAPLAVLAADGGEELVARVTAPADGPSPVVVALGLTVLAGNEAFAARVLVAMRPDSQAGAAPSARWSRQVLRSLGPIPLRVPIVTGDVLSTVADVASLRAGDVWVPPAGCFPGGAPGGALRGSVFLAAPSSAVGVRAELGEGGHLVLSDHVDLLTRDGELAESDAKTALLDAVGDVPVVVRVELGEAQMLAREWADLRSGDVIALGRRVGEQVVLRVGGVAVARGELVTIDGEVGVRIAERMTEGEPTAS